MSGSGLPGSFDLDEFFSDLTTAGSSTINDYQASQKNASPCLEAKSDSGSDQSSRWAVLPHDVLQCLLQPRWGVNPGVARMVCQHWRDAVHSTHEIMCVSDWPPNPTSIVKFAALTSLDLSHCYFDPRSKGQMDELLAELAQLPALIHLLLSKESLLIKQSLRSRLGRTRLFYVMELPASVGRLSSLQLLSVAPCSHHNRGSNITSVVELPQELSHLTALTCLKLSNAKQPLAHLGSPTRLKHLELHGAVSIQASMVQILGLSQLQHLTLDFKNSVQVVWGVARAQLLQQCAQAVAQLPHLTELRFLNVKEPRVVALDVQVEVQMGEHVDSIKLEPAEQQLQDPKLQVLEFSHWSPSPLSITSSEAMLLPSLTSLTIAFNTLNHLPHQVSQLSRLTYLDIRSNQGLGGALPAELGCLSDLEVLYAQHNSMTAINSLSGLKKLQAVDLSHNFVTALGAEFAELTGLTRLEFSCNHICEVSPCVTALKQLVHCDLHRNRLKELPSELSTLVRLTFLNVSYNHLQQVPDALSGMTQLQDLAIHYQEAVANGAQEEGGGAAYFEARDLHLVLYSQKHTLPPWLGLLPGLKRVWIDEDPHMYSEVLNVLRTRGVKLNESEPQSWQRGLLGYHEDF